MFDRSLCQPRGDRGHEHGSDLGRANVGHLQVTETALVFQHDRVDVPLEVVLLVGSGHHLEELPLLDPRCPEVFDRAGARNFLTRRYTPLGESVDELCLLRLRDLLVEGVKGVPFSLHLPICVDRDTDMVPVLPELEIACSRPRHFTSF
ncbi:MAG: hypothetical protein ACMG6S_05560 [Byssovorax sp.]